MDMGTTRLGILYLMVLYALTVRVNHNDFYCTALQRWGVVRSFKRLRPQHTLVRSTFDDIEDCWKADSWTVNPSNDAKIDTILQSLSRPAPQSFYAIQRALRKSPALTSEVLSNCTFLLKDGSHGFWCRQSSVALSSSPGDDWTTVPTRSHVPNDDSWVLVAANPKIDDRGDNASTKQLVNHVLEYLVSRSESQTPYDESHVNSMYALIKERLNFTLGTDIRGRTAADTAFLLALSGCQDDELFLILAKVARLELRRSYRRGSRTTKDILHVVEKLAAAGVRGHDVELANHLVANMLRERNVFLQVADDLSSPGSYGLLSPRPLLWLWRFSSRLRKPSSSQVAQEPSIAPTNKNTRILKKASWKFLEETRPLVIDLGCGLGVSLLGLATLKGGPIAYGRELGDLTVCNFLGCDLNQQLIRYGAGIASRWNLTDRLQYAYLPVERLLEQVTMQYEGPVKLVMIQFPTPFKISESDVGNQQLPTLTDRGFMISAAVMKTISDLLQPNGMLLVQSNCEDVAIYLRDLAEAHGLQAVPMPNPKLEPYDSGYRRTKRTQEWIEAGGERAVGDTWSAQPILPDTCATETEIACNDSKTPVHRILFRAKAAKDA